MGRGCGVYLYPEWSLTSESSTPESALPGVSVDQVEQDHLRHRPADGTLGRGPHRNADPDHTETSSGRQWHAEVNPGRGSSGGHDTTVGGQKERPGGVQSRRGRDLVHVPTSGRSGAGPPVWSDNPRKRLGTDVGTFAFVEDSGTTGGSRRVPPSVRRRAEDRAWGTERTVYENKCSERASL